MTVSDFNGRNGAVEVGGGLSKKGCVFGLGSRSEAYAAASRCSSATFSLYNERLKKQMRDEMEAEIEARLEARVEAQMETLQAQMDERMESRMQLQMQTIMEMISQRFTGSS
ncbi:hypothetical protein C2S52_012170 [Perilla frutescens var. hirtella]|nr:hypothetical protein C2S52_012170 [Perilla frutescens var. hirtella]